MLREVKNARLQARRTLRGRRYRLVENDRPGSISWGASVQRDQATTPTPLFHRGHRTYWAFEHRVYWEDEALTAADVRALVRERQRRSARRLARAHAALTATTTATHRRAPVPSAVRRAVFDRDGGRCVQCGSAFDIQYDHVIPVALGGASTAENLQILCAPCNRAKGAALA